MDDTSGIGVLDKVVLILDLLAREPLSLPQLTEVSELAKPTAHRLLQGLVHHGLVERDATGRYSLAMRMAQWGAAASSASSMTARAQPVLDALCRTTGLSAQLYVRSGAGRLCLATSEPTSGLRDTVPVGSHLTLHAGSAAQVLLAWEDPASIQSLLGDSVFSTASLAEVRRRGHAVSVAEREQGVASVSAPVWQSERVAAAISVSGPIDLMTRRPGPRFAAAVTASGAELSTKAS